MTDRDHFAAAALTGLLASDNYTRTTTSADHAEVAYELADAMLRCRGTGDTPKPISGCVSDRSKPIAVEPVAWGVFRSDGEVAVIAFKRQDAEERATASDRVVPLYRSPTLTDAEREDMECAASRLQSDPNGPRDLQVADTLRGLLERLGGGR